MGLCGTPAELHSSQGFTDPDHSLQLAHCDWHSWRLTIIIMYALPHLHTIHADQDGSAIHCCNMYELRGSTVCMVLAKQGLQLCHNSKEAFDANMATVWTMDLTQSCTYTKNENVNSCYLLPDVRVLTGKVGRRFLSDAGIAALAAVLHIPGQEGVLLYQSTFCIRQQL